MSAMWTRLLLERCGPRYEVSQPVDTILSCIIPRKDRVPIASTRPWCKFSRNGEGQTPPYWTLVDTFDFLENTVFDAARFSLEHGAAVISTLDDGYSTLLREAAHCGCIKAAQPQLKHGSKKPTPSCLIFVISHIHE